MSIAFSNKFSVDKSTNGSGGERTGPANRFRLAGPFQRLPNLSRQLSLSPALGLAIWASERFRCPPPADPQTLNRTLAELVHIFHTVDVLHRECLWICKEFPLQPRIIRHNETVAGRYTIGDSKIYQVVSNNALCFIFS